ncbi:MAG TPA: iron-sulfur cluster repair di-iron protein [Cyclobacteriaceae bacterium]|nr:iron-sulfur cluster repair di-iron protein [Cyclobacteriaceae bacterium]
MTIASDRLDMEQVSVADVALTFPQALEIFNRYGLDYCCGGKKLFTSACEKAGLDAGSVWQEIQSAAANRGADSRVRFDTWDAPLLISFIVQHHHQYVRTAIPQIQELLDKVCSVHREDSPFLLTVRENFNDLAEELLNHMPKEEQVLFPAIQKMFGGNSFASDSVILNNLNMPIEVMEDEHERAGDLIKSIRSLTNQYIPPVYACPTFKMTYIMLEQFDNDLMQHIHLENNILFPKAKSMASTYL